MSGPLINPSLPVAPVFTGESDFAQPVTSATSSNAPLAPSLTTPNQSSPNQNQNRQSQPVQSHTTQQKGFHLNNHLSPNKWTLRDLRIYWERKVVETCQIWQQFTHTKVGHRLAYEIEQTRICAVKGYSDLQDNEHLGKVLPDFTKRAKCHQQKKDDLTSRMTRDELSEYRADHALPPSAEEIARNPNAEKHDAIQLDMIHENPWNSHLFTHPEVELAPQNTLWDRMRENVKIKTEHQWEQSKASIRHQYHHANDNRDNT